MRARRFRFLEVNPGGTGIWTGSGDETFLLPLVPRGGIRIALPECMREEESKSPVHPRRSRSLVLALSFLVLTGAGLWFWTNHASEPAQASQPDPVRSILHLETFVRNLADNDQRSYLRVGIDLALNQEAKHAEETVPIAEVRDTILGVLGEDKVSDLPGPGGKMRLKHQILQGLQDRVPALGVEEVYFTEFLIQR